MSLLYLCAMNPFRSSIVPTYAPSLSQYASMACDNGSRHTDSSKKVSRLENGVPLKRSLNVLIR
jgi:hypothetical protein